MINELFVIGFLTGSNIVFIFLLYKKVLELEYYNKLQDEVLSRQAKLICNNEMNIIMHVKGGLKNDKRS